MNMKISILPKSAFGWWSFGLAIATIAFGFGVLEPILTQAAHQNNITLFAILSFVISAIGGAASATGLISIIKRRQGAILVFISTAIGLVFLITEFADAVQAMMGQGF
jgi:undecaprenyl pyrophosphate phosphatase UppP